MGAIWDLDLPHALVWVLMAYADHADHDGRNCFPSAGLIAYKTGYSLRQVQRVTAALVERGVLIVERRGGGRAQPTRYRIDLKRAPLKAPYTYDEPRILPQKNSDKMSLFSGNYDILGGETMTFPGGPEPKTMTFSGLNYDIAMSPKPLTVATVNEPSDEPLVSPEFSAFRREADEIVRTGLGAIGGQWSWSLSGQVLTLAFTLPAAWMQASRSPTLKNQIGSLARRILGHVAFAIARAED